MTTPRRRRAVSVESLDGALPHPLPDCHLVRTAIPYLPLEDCLGDFHSITHRFYPLLQAWFQGAISPSSAATDANASLPYPDMSTQGRLHCTQQRDSAHCIAGSIPVSYAVRVRKVLYGCRTIAGLHGIRVGRHMPLRLARKP